MVIEDKIISTINNNFLTDSDVIVDIGDDCSVIKMCNNSNKYTVTTTAQVVSGVHYLLNTNTSLAGKKLLKKCLSNFAAIGGAVPKYASLSIVIQNKYYNSIIDDFFCGIIEEAKRWNIKICGGDTNLFKSKDSKLQMFSSMTLIGFIKKNSICLKSNAKPGDLLYTTGYIGNSFNSEHHINFIPRLNEAMFLSKKHINSMTDTSDGLLFTTFSIAKHSNVTIYLYTNNIPLRYGCKNYTSAITDGEDYELVFTVSPKIESQIIRTWPFETKITKIGHVTDRQYNKFVINTITKKEFVYSF